VFAVAHVLGLLLASFALTYLLPIACSLIMADGLWPRFLLAGLITAGAGLLLAVLTFARRRELRPRDGFMLVTLGWLLLCAAASLPLFLALPGLPFTVGFFEAVSGLTTTGSTMLSGLDQLPPSLNFWRHALHWFGGLGIIVMGLAVLPLLGVGGMQLYKGAAGGPVRDERLAPRITETAKQLWLVYALLTVAGIIALRIAGMSWFDAVCHAFSAVGLGGFSTHDRSIAYFNSAAIEVVLIVLMVIASLNFARHFIALRRLSLDTYRQDPEVRAIFAVLAVSVIGIALLLNVHGVYAGFAPALRAAAFNVVSQATTSGLTSDDYETWPVFAPYWMLFLSCIVCSTGSTGGGIKMFRTLLLARQAGREMKLLVHPAAVAPLRIGGRPIPDNVLRSVLAFIFL
jgi:trk system potassium uptake protein